MNTIDKIIYENGSVLCGMFIIKDNKIMDLNGNVQAEFLKLDSNRSYGRHALVRDPYYKINQPLIEDTDKKLKPALVKLFQIFRELVNKYDLSELTDESNLGFNNLDQVEIMTQQCLNAARKLKKNFYISKE